MFLSKLIYKFFPEQVFIYLRKIFRSILKQIFPPLSESAFKKILSNKLQIKKGSVVFIHSSMDCLNVRFDSLRLFEMLLDAVGEEGTLVFPCWHFTYRAEDYLKSGKIFDVKHSHSALGMLSEIARRYPGSFRSLHPTNSIVAIGKHAFYITKDHHTDLYPCGEKSPYYRVVELNGLIIGIGVNAHFMSLVHCPEDVLKQKFPIKTRLDHVFEAKVKNEDGSIQLIKTLAAHPQIKYNDINAFVKNYISKSVCKNVTTKGNRFFVAHAKTLFESIVELAKVDKTIYLTKANLRN